MGDDARFRRGEGTPPYARVFKWGRRAASPLAAVEACGGGKLSGRDESLPYELTARGDMASGCRPGVPGPYTGCRWEDGKWHKTGRWCLHNFAAGLII